MKVKKNSLQFELSLKFAIVFIITIFAISSAIIFYMSNQYNKIIVQNMNNNMENVVRSIDYYFEDVKTPMVMIARNRVRGHFRISFSLIIILKPLNK